MHSGFVGFDSEQLKRATPKQHRNSTKTTSKTVGHPEGLLTVLKLVEDPLDNTYSVSTY
jgi:hypothetical protein